MFRGGGYGIPGLLRLLSGGSHVMHCHHRREMAWRVFYYLAWSERYFQCGPISSEISPSVSAGIREFKSGWILLVPPSIHLLRRHCVYCVFHLLGTFSFALQGYHWPQLCNLCNSVRCRLPKSHVGFCRTQCSLYCRKSILSSPTEHPLENLSIAKELVLYAKVGILVSLIPRDSLRFEIRLNYSINPRKLSIFYRSFLEPKWSSIDILVQNLLMESSSSSSEASIRSADCDTLLKKISLINGLSS